MKGLKIICTSFFLLLFLTTQGQTGETFVSLEGKAALFTSDGKKVSKTEIPSVHSKIDFETKAMIFHFEIQGGQDEIIQVSFKGILDIDRFLSDGVHSSQEFLIHGNLDINGESSPVILKATKDHLGISDDINCRLIASLELKPDQFKSSVSSTSGCLIDLVLLIPKYNAKLSK